VRISRVPPTEDLGTLVDHFVAVQWSLPRGHALDQATLAHPSVHWTVEGTRSEIVGVRRGRFVRTLSGNGHIVAVRFRPGGFCAIYKGSLHVLTDRRLPATEVLGHGVRDLAGRLRYADDVTAVRVFADMLRELKPSLDSRAQLAGTIVEHIASHPELTSVESVCARFAMSPLTLQRLFRNKIGVSPKSVLQRYRLREAVESLATRSSAESLADVAQRLGFTDQAHFSRVFRSFVGESPAQYARRQLATSP
jgi:AraC-like DNA-binding protein